jgi:hypothetical protein
VVLSIILSSISFFAQGQKSIHLGLNVAQYNFSLDNLPLIEFDQGSQRGLVNLSYISDGIISGFTVGISNPSDDYFSWDVGGNLGFIINKNKRLQFPIIGHVGFLTQEVRDDKLSGLYISGKAECRLFLSRDFYLNGGLNYGVGYISKFNEVDINKDNPATRVAGFHVGFGLRLKSDI